MLSVLQFGVLQQNLRKFGLNPKEWVLGKPCPRPFSNLIVQMSCKSKNSIGKRIFIPIMHRSQSRIMFIGHALIQKINDQTRVTWKQLEVVDFLKELDH